MIVILYVCVYTYVHTWGERRHFLDIICIHMYCPCHYDRKDYSKRL